MTMTNNQAIDRLRNIAEKTPIRTNGDDLLALTKAISALENISHLKDRPCDACEFKVDGNCQKEVGEVDKNTIIDLR